MSDYALQTWDDQGRLTLDTGMRPQRIIGTITVLGGAPAGQFTDTRLTEGEPAWIVLSSADTYYDRPALAFDRATSTFSWPQISYGFVLLYGTF